MKTYLASMVCASLVLTACVSAPNSTGAQTSSPAATGSTMQADAGAATANVSAAGVIHESANKEAAAGVTNRAFPGVAAAQQNRSLSEGVYFDFDQFAIKPEFRGLIRQQAEYVKSHPGTVVVLQGFADERGSAEYNLALGSKRADSVRETLEIMGVQSERIKTVSFGEEKPRLTCHEEKCWKENRRVDFVEKAAG
ncbi:MAG: peptidoglycan-associated lipoprotein Pal [Sideroxydans sp.]|nr:peptidoglycan-associated lipoprotein Pal [Sideroxydans sp.]